MSAGRAVPAHTSAIVEWRRAALAAMQGKARAIALIAVLPVVLDKAMQTQAGNKWFMAETSMPLRSVQFGLEDLKDAGLVEIENIGPRRTITAVIPTADATEKHERSRHASEHVEGVRTVHSDSVGEGERSGPKPRLKRTPIGDRSPPYPPRSRLPEFSQSRKVARQSAAAPWQPGTMPRWASDGDPPVVDADGAAHAAPEPESSSGRRLSSRRAERGREGALP